MRVGEHDAPGGAVADIVQAYRCLRAKLGPDLPISLHGESFGVVLLDKADFPRGIAALRKAVALDPKYTRADASSPYVTGTWHNHAHLTAESTEPARLRLCRRDGRRGGRRRPRHLAERAGELALVREAGAADRVRVLSADVVAAPPPGRYDVAVLRALIQVLDREQAFRAIRHVASALEPGGVFCNLEHVASPTPRVHERFLEAMGIGPEDEDPSNKLLDVETQLGWLRELGFVDVDCQWKWRELALLVGSREL